MTEEPRIALECPKDRTAMEPMGRRRGAWRCPECRGIFLDRAAMPGGAAGRPPAWAPVVMSVVMSVLATVIVRRLRRPKSSSQAAAGRGPIRG